MSIQRTHKKTQKKWLKENNNLKILDLGCTQINFWPEANHFADIVDYSSEFLKKNLNFIKIFPNQKLPFKDKEFDYVILSHVLEHIPNLIDFKKEVERIAKAGYIELPTKLNDNIVFGCDEEDVGHKWWFEFDDVNQKLLYLKKIDVLEKFLTVGQIYKLQHFFEDSFLLQLYWEDEINLLAKEPFKKEEKILFFTLVRKFFSKKIRVILSSIKAFFSRK